MEQRRPLPGRPGAVTAREAQHRVLHEVECFVAIACRLLGHPQRAPLDAGQELAEAGIARLRIMHGTRV
jgi:hypothetical protein